MSNWRVIAEPQGDNPGTVKKAAAERGVGSASKDKNVGGMVIYVTDGSKKEEVSRVAWVRRNSKNPKNSFEKQLGLEVEKARKAVKVIQDLFSGATGELQ